MNNSNIIATNDTSFEKEVLAADLPVLVDFWAEWCGPCKLLASVLDELAQEKDFREKIKIAKLNVDENPKTPAKYGIRGIPTLILFKDGKALNTKVGGGLSLPGLKEFLNKNLN